MIQSDAGFQHVNIRTGVCPRPVAPVPAVNGAAAAIGGNESGASDCSLFRSDQVAGEGVSRVCAAQT